MIVVNTNVMVQLLLGGQHAAATGRLLRRDPAWFAPPILLSELRNVLVGYIRRGTLSRREARTLTHRASSVLGRRITGVSTRAVVNTALDCGLTAYDAEFVVLARTLKCPLATLDSAILRSASDVAHPPDALSGPRTPSPAA